MVKKAFKRVFIGLGKPSKHNYLKKIDFKLTIFFKIDAHDQRKSFVKTYTLYFLALSLSLRKAK